MMNDSAAILDDLLSRWHSHCRAYQANQQAPRDPVFRDAKSGRGWDSTDEIIEDEIHGSMMADIDFQVSEMRDPHRAAIYALARNLSTGNSVWMSPRLPRDAVERARVVAEARGQITDRLMRCGVM
ncbi:hypothetical protein VLK31_34875 [Variovorax sp. H27-G14]|uniref:hypothetical protein n=1 Tax=Variovorax sp. H27-G14 TaxID=3111914 RepID=UPI0038FD2CB7